MTRVNCLTHLRFLLLLCLAFTLSGCGGEAPGPLHIGSNRWIGYEPFFYARLTGLLQDETATVDEFPNSSDVISALRLGNLDGACLTLDEVLNLRAEGVALKIVLVLDASAGADAVLAHPEINSPQQLAGKRIGYESTAVGALMLASLLERAALSTSDVELKHVPVNEHFRAFSSGDVDAVVTFEPIKARLLERGANVVFDSAEIPNRIIDVLAVREKVLDERAEGLQVLVDAWFSAVGRMQAEPDDANLVVAKRLEVEADAVAKARSGILVPSRDENRALLEGGSSAALLRSVEEVSAVLRSSGLLSGTIELIGLLDSRLVN